MTLHQARPRFEPLQAIDWGEVLPAPGLVADAEADRKLGASRLVPSKSQKHGATTRH